MGSGRKAGRGKRSGTAVRVPYAVGQGRVLELPGFRVLRVCRCTGIPGNVCGSLLTPKPYSKLLKGCYVGSYIGEFIRFTYCLGL